MNPDEITNHSLAMIYSMVFCPIFVDIGQFYPFVKRTWTTVELQVLMRVYNIKINFLPKGHST